MLDSVFHRFHIQQPELLYDSAKGMLCLVTYLWIAILFFTPEWSREINH